MSDKNMKGKKDFMSYSMKMTSAKMSHSRSSELEPHSAEGGKLFNIPLTATKYRADGAFWHEHQICSVLCVLVCDFHPHGKCLCCNAVRCVRVTA